MSKPLLAISNLSDSNRCDFGCYVYLVFNSFTGDSGLRFCWQSVISNRTSRSLAIAIWRLGHLVCKLRSNLQGCVRGRLAQASDECGDRPSASEKSLLCVCARFKARDMTLDSKAVASL